LVFDLSALCALRDEGIEFEKLKDQDFSDPRLIRKLLWAALLEENPDLSLREVGGWVDLENFAAVVGRTVDAFIKSSGQELPTPP
jgi:hypothetical protein